LSGKNKVKLGDLVEWQDDEPDYSGVYTVVRIHGDSASIYSAEMGREVEVGLDEIQSMG
jgi:hypothetical protein